eukprot:COSAG02_NODE_529_length_20702_cov_43.720555_15_plen_105_part_00
MVASFKTQNSRTSGTYHVSRSTYRRLLVGTYLRLSQVPFIHHNGGPTQHVTSQRTTPSHLLGNSYLWSHVGSQKDEQCFHAQQRSYLDAKVIDLVHSHSVSISE